MEGTTGPEAMRLNTHGLKSFWRSRALRGVDFADQYERLDALYRIKDPWDFTEPHEQVRFQETNRIICREFGRIGTLLEIGCAEGHQTLHLMEVCRQVYGLDVSLRAVRRAKRRCPGAAFVAGDLTKVARFINAPQRFDVAVACEVLYYIEDVPKALKQMSDLGRHSLVTYYSSHREKLDHELAHIHIAGREIIRCQHHFWSVVWWRND